MTRLGALFRQRRVQKGLRVSQLAKLAWPYKKGCVRIHWLEKFGNVHPPLLRKLAEVLGITEAEYLPLFQADEQDRLRRWQEWVNESVKPYYVIRLMPAMYNEMPLPESVQTLEEAEEFVAQKAAELHLRCCLVWSRKLALYFAADGTIERVAEAASGHDSTPRQIM